MVSRELVPDEDVDAPARGTAERVDVGAPEGLRAPRPGVEAAPAPFEKIVEVVVAEEPGSAEAAGEPKLVGERVAQERVVVDDDGDPEARGRFAVGMAGERGELLLD